MKYYPKYKDSNINWAMSIPATWKVQKIKYGLLFRQGLKFTCRWMLSEKEMKTYSIRIQVIWQQKMICSCCGMGVTLEKL